MYSRNCRPAIVFLREVDSDVPCMGKVYYRCFQLQQKLAAVEWLEEEEQKWLSDQWQYRWNQLHSDMHACGEQLCAACLSAGELAKHHSIDDQVLIAGYVCDPEYRLHDVMDIPDVTAGFWRQAQRMLPDDYQKLNSELEIYRWIVMPCLAHGPSCVCNC